MAAFAQSTPARRNPPGPRYWRPLGAFDHMRRDPTGFLYSLAQEYGDVAHFRSAGRHIYLFAHPDAIRSVLVAHERSFIKSRALQNARDILGNGLLTSEGELHERQRKLMQPVFHRQRIAAFGNLMVEESMAAMAHWEDGAALDIHKEMMSLALAIVARALFSTDVHGQAAIIGRAVDTLTRSFWRTLLPFRRLLDRLPTETNRKLRAALNDLDTIVYAMIAERRRGQARDEAVHEASDDLLSLLLAAHEPGAGDGMSDRQIRDEALTLLLAGHETTANALTYVWYLLAENPDAEAALHEELAHVLAGRAATTDDLPRLTVTRAIVSESMRLYPPAWVIGRQAVQDVQIAGITVPRGATVLVSPWVTHHDPRFFPDPWRFSLGHWTPEAVEARPKFAYFPFGGGSRVCIGEHFAWMEAVLAVATIAAHWRFDTAVTKIPLQASVTLRPRDGLPMRLARRT